MLQPKRTKHRKAQKGRIREVAKRGSTIAFGSYALKSLEAIWLTNRQLEAARQALTRAMKREGNVWIRVFPDKPITKKPLEVRMGKGKGNPEYWAAVVEPGRILFEADGVPMAVAKEALELAAQKLPIKTKFVDVLDHFSLGVRNVEAAYTLLWRDDRLEGQDNVPKIGRDAKWQLNLIDPDGTRAEIMELHAIGKPCCSPFTASDPTY